MHDAFDRGYACLDIEYTYPEDTGLYSVVVRNRSGDVQADPVQIRWVFALFERPLIWGASKGPNTQSIQSINKKMCV